MKSRESRKVIISFQTVASMLAALIMIVPGFSRAAEINFPLRAYSGEELTKVREWEKAWVGKKIDKSNIDQVAEYLPESFVGIYKNPKKWGAPEGKDIYFYIVPYQRIIETKGMIEATKKYSPTVKLDKDGMITNYTEIAGIPFPNPKTGLEIAWNYDFNTHGDSSHWRRDGPVVTPGVKVERTSDQDMWELFWMHRVDVDPRPAFKKNPKGIYKGLFMHLYKPPESRNTRYFNLRYVDPKKSDDGYMWYAEFRRIRRLSTGQRTDTIDGTDMIYDDGNFWDGHMLRNTYKYLGTKELLCTRHIEYEDLKRPKGQTIFNNIKRERLKTFVVEAINKDPNYVYGKRIWYVDPETYYILWTELYDQLMRFWKCFENLNKNVKTEWGGEKNYIVASVLIDFQRIHGGCSTDHVKEVGTKSIRPSMFTVRNLQKVGY